MIDDSNNCGDRENETDLASKVGGGCKDATKREGKVIFLFNAFSVKVKGNDRKSKVRNFGQEGVGKLKNPREKDEDESKEGGSEFGDS